MYTDISDKLMRSQSFDAERSGFACNARQVLDMENEIREQKRYNAQKDNVIFQTAEEIKKQNTIRKIRRRPRPFRIYARNMLKTAISTKQNPRRKFVIPDNTTYSTVQKINNNVSTGQMKKTIKLQIRLNLMFQTELNEIITMQNVLCRTHSQRSFGRCRKKTR